MKEGGAVRELGLQGVGNALTVRREELAAGRLVFSVSAQAMFDIGHVAGDRRRYVIDRLARERLIAQTVHQMNVRIFVRAIVVHLKPIGYVVDDF